MKYVITGTNPDDEVSHERGTFEEAQEVAIDLTKRGFRAVVIKQSRAAAPSRGNGGMRLKRQTNGEAE